MKRFLLAILAVVMTVTAWGIEHHTTGNLSTARNWQNTTSGTVTLDNFDWNYTVSGATLSSQNNVLRMTVPANVKGTVNVSFELRTKLSNYGKVSINNVKAESSNNSTIECTNDYDNDLIIITVSAQLAKKEYIELTSIDFDVCKRFDLTIGTCTWASMYLDFAAEVPEGATAYYASAVSDNTVTLKSVEKGNILPANTGVIVNGSTCKFIEAAEDNAVKVDNNMFEGVTVATPCDERSVWVLNGSQSKAEAPVLSLYTGTKLGANKAYLPANKVAPEAKTLKFVIEEDNTTTGVNVVSNVANNGVAYNLSGQRVAANAKGIVIMNGKKYINK